MFVNWDLRREHLPWICSLFGKHLSNHLHGIERDINLERLEAVDETIWVRKECGSSYSHPNPLFKKRLALWLRCLSVPFHVQDNDVERNAAIYVTFHHIMHPASAVIGPNG